MHACIVTQSSLILGILWTVVPQAPLSMRFFRQEDQVVMALLPWQEWVAIFLLQGIFPTQGSNLHLPCLLHCRPILYPLSHQGSPEWLQQKLNPEKALTSWPSSIMQLKNCVWGNSENKCPPKFTSAFLSPLVLGQGVVPRRCLQNC